MRFGGLFGVKLCPIRHYPREQANNEAQLWSLGVALLTALSIPRVSSMRKKTAAQAEDSGSVAIASG